MNENKARVVELEPFRAASFHAYGTQPELDALAKLEAWAKAKGISDDPASRRVFGFNNPNPSPGTPNYGYEVWLVVGPETQAEGDIEIIDFPGGLYAVLHWDGGSDPNEGIPAAWKELVLWREGSPYQGAGHQWLEEHLPPEEASLAGFTLDLYLPIAKA
jgi:AraC family transcriptional regulator